MVISKTPLRISFFGGGSDYPAWYKDNGGAVLSTSIDKYFSLTCREFVPYFGFKHHIVWSKKEEAKSTDDIQHPIVREAFKYLDIKKGIEVHYIADLPARSGLGSGSTFTVSLLHALHTLEGREPSKEQLALEAIHIERDRLGENVGSQDQTAAAFGGFNKIEFSGDDKIKVHPLKIEKDKLKYLEKHLLLFSTGIYRRADSIAAEQVKKTPNLHSEIKTLQSMVDEGIDILKGPRENINNFGKLLDNAWDIKRGLTSKISNSTIDAIYEKAKDKGAIGGKLLGAGGGGFILFFAEPQKHDIIKDALNNLTYVPFEFESKGSHIIFNSHEGQN
ncbi:MAG: hypothetical protein R3251_00505 [Candidatus Spechtbacterales bacterium]|nr:hypothetical protein [Candidatus Spechtbacterales bacterium]